MAKKKEAPVTEEEKVETAQRSTVEAPPTDPWEEKYNAEHDSYLRLAADYDNFRKRT